MGRISRACMFMEMARVASRRSTCFRLNVGAIVTHNNSPVSVGYNGAEAGMPHCLGNDCPGIVPGKCETKHAELNALEKAEALLPEGTEVDLYTTDSPCRLCTGKIAIGLLQVKRVFFETPYRDLTHLHIFERDYGIQVLFPNEPEKAYTKVRNTAVYEVTPAGYIVEYFSRKVVELP